MYGLHAILNWLNLSLCLLKGLIGVIASAYTFIAQIAFALVGLIHLILLPHLTEASNVTDLRNYLQFLRHFGFTT